MCDYPQTSYFDCLISCPTIMVFDYKKNWTPLKKFFKLYDLLEKNNLLFRDINKATKFINNNWDQIDEWWNSSKIFKIRKGIFEEFGINTKVNGINKWHKFIEKTFTKNKI